MKQKNYPNNHFSLIVYLLYTTWIGNFLIAHENHISYAANLFIKEFSKQIQLNNSIDMVQEVNST